MARYHFVTDLEVATRRDPCWRVLSDPTGFPAWWRWLRSVEVLEEGAADGTGARHRWRFGTALPYRLTFETEVVCSRPPSVLGTRATGELAGIGSWQLTDTPAGTAIRYSWIVDTTKRWMNRLAPVARPAFSWNHDVLMRDFARGFSGAVDAPLVSLDNRTIDPRDPGFGQLAPTST